MNIEPLESTGRWWRVNGHDYDLGARAGPYPANVRAAILAHRDQAGTEDANMAAYAAWLVDEQVTCPDPWVTGFVFDHCQRLYQRIRAQLTEGDTHVDAA